VRISHSKGGSGLGKEKNFVERMTPYGEKLNRKKREI